MIELISLTGQQVLNRKVNPQDGSTDRHRPAPGVYWLRLSDGEFFSGQKVVVE